MSVDSAAPKEVKHTASRIKFIATLILGLVIGGGISALYFKARRNSEFKIATTFVLKVGTDQYTIIEDEAFPMKVGDKVVQSILNRRNRLKYDQNGFAFSYPSAMRISPSTENGVTDITLICIDSPTVLMKVYELAGGNIDIAREKIQKQLDQSLAQSNATITEGSNKPVQRTIAGAMRTGSSIEYNQSGLDVKREIFAFATANHIVTAVYQYHVQEAELANRYFGVINETMK